MRVACILFWRCYFVRASSGFLCVPNQKLAGHDGSGQRATPPFGRVYRASPLGSAGRGVPGRGAVHPFVGCTPTTAVYMEQHAFLRKECQAATERTIILNDLLGAEHTFFDFLTARRRELDRAVEKERLEWYDLELRQRRLRNELEAVGLTLGPHPATGEWGIRTLQEQWGHRNETGSEDTESVLCAGASAADHVRLRPSRSAHPQHYD